MKSLAPILQKELRDASRSRWLTAYAAAFAVLAVAMAYAGSRSMGGLAFEGYDRVTASLLNLCLFLVPLVALVLGSATIAGERERGVLSYVLSHPVSPHELLLGKFLGLALAVALGTILGFGLAGITIAVVAPVAGLGTYLLFVALVVALGVAMLSIAVLISVLSGTRAKAMALATLTWFGLVIFYDLAIIVLTTALDLSADSLTVAVIMNPVEVARILTVLALEPDLKVLGPLGAFMVNTFGTRGAAALLIGALATWMVAPLGLALKAFSFPEE